MWREILQRIVSRLFGTNGAHRDDGDERSPTVTAALQAAQRIYVAYQLEQVRLFDVVDRLVEDFVQGTLPVGRGAGGQALDDYYSSRDLRLSGAERRDLYSRTLGQGESPDANREFHDLWLRFIRSVSVLARAATVPGREDVSAAQVREAARRLASNVSGRADSRVVLTAERLDGQVQAMARIVSDHEVLRATGSADMWELVERVAESRLGATVNAARYRTLADAGATILGWLSERAETMTDPERPFLPVDPPRNRAPCLFWLATARTDGDVVAACLTLAEAEE